MGARFKGKKREAPKETVEVCTQPKQPDPKRLKGNPQKVQNRLRTHHHINVWGSELPPIITEFTQLIDRYNVDPKLVENINQCGYGKPTAIQMQAIPAMLQHRELLACAPTGSGKTAAFLIPIIHLLGKPSYDGFRVIVICPTRELAKQTYREAMRLTEGTGLRTYVLSKTTNAQKRFGSDTTKSLDIMVTTPNRLVWMLKDTKLHFNKVEYLIIDESDRLFEAGKSGFRDQLVKIYEACDSGKLRRAMFSATCSKDLDRWCKVQLDSLISVSVGAKNVATNQVEQSLVFVGTEQGKLFEIRRMISSGVKPPVLVFVETKSKAKSLHSQLVLDGLNVDVIHSERTINERDKIIDHFRLGKIWILICTELMGRGIDFKGVNLVVNYDFPQTPVAYIHRIGRTGRADRTGQAVTFFTEIDSPLSLIHI